MRLVLEVALLRRRQSENSTAAGQCIQFQISSAKKYLQLYSVRMHGFCNSSHKPLTKELSRELVPIWVHTPQFS